MEILIGEGKSGRPDGRPLGSVTSIEFDVDAVTVSLTITDAGFTVTKISLVTVAKVPGISLVPFRDGVSHTLVAFVLLVPVVAASWLGGAVPGIVAAVISSAAFNVGFLPPYGTFSFERTEYLVAFLASDQAACITGQVYVIDGGTLAKRPRRSMSDWERYLEEHAS